MCYTAVSFSADTLSSTSLEPRLGWPTCRHRQAGRLHCKETKSGLSSAIASSFWIIFALACGIKDTTQGTLCCIVEYLHRWPCGTLALVPTTNTDKAYLRWAKTHFTSNPTTRNLPGPPRRQHPKTMLNHLRRRDGHPYLDLLKQSLYP